MRLSGRLASGCVRVEEASHDGGAGSSNGWVGLRVRLRQVRVHELSQGVEPGAQQLGRVQRRDGDVDVDRGRGHERRLGLDHLRLNVRLRSDRARSATEGLVRSLGVFVRRGLLLLLGNQPWWTRQNEKYVTCLQQGVLSVTAGGVCLTAKGSTA